MKNKLSYILCILTVCVFVMIFVQNRTGMFKFQKLNGVYYTSEKVPLTFDNFVNGSYQRSLENDIRYDFGFREPLIRLHNQYIWDFYRKSSNYTIMVGKDNWLYGRDELTNYYQSAMYSYTNDKNVMKHSFDLEAQRMYKVQNILAEYDIFIFMSMLPAKTFIYPEYLPENPGLKLPPLHGFKYLPPVFDSLNINYINIQRIFENQKDVVDYPLFPKSGKHWTFVAAAHAFDTTLRYAEKNGNMNIHNYSISEKYPCEAVYPDNDYELVLNLMRPIRGNNYYYTNLQVDNDPSAIKPQYLIIGDSFFFNINKIVPLSQIFKSYHYWYYNSTIYYDSKHNHTSEVDILDEIMNSKIINLSYSPEQLYVFSNGFLPKALLYLTHDDSEIDSTLNAIASTIDNSSAEERLKSAKEILFKEPEQFFPDLANDDVPATRNSRISLILNDKQHD